MYNYCWAGCVPCVCAEWIGRKLVHGVHEYVCQHSEDGADAAEPRTHGHPSPWADESGLYRGWYVEYRVRFIVPLSVPPSVSHKNFHLAHIFWSINDRTLIFGMIFFTSPFNFYHAETLTFDLLQGQICCRMGNHTSWNLLVHHKNLHTIGRGQNSHYWASRICFALAQ